MLQVQHWIGIRCTLNKTYLKNRPYWVQLVKAYNYCNVTIDFTKLPYCFMERPEKIFIHFYFYFLQFYAFFYKLY